MKRTVCVRINAGERKCEACQWCATDGAGIGFCQLYLKKERGLVSLLPRRLRGVLAFRCPACLKGEEKL